jgi:hypothetical protein
MTPSIRFADDLVIVQAINSESIGEEDLAHRVCWQVICRARGRLFRYVKPAAWRSVCARRGYILYRRNSKNF